MQRDASKYARELAVDIVLLRLCIRRRGTRAACVRVLRRGLDTIAPERRRFVPLFC